MLSCPSSTLGTRAPVPTLRYCVMKSPSQLHNTVIPNSMCMLTVSTLMVLTRPQRSQLGSGLTRDLKASLFVQTVHLEGKAVFLVLDVSEGN